jgi:hypothetical protein
MVRGEEGAITRDDRPKERPIRSPQKARQNKISSDMRAGRHLDVESFGGLRVRVSNLHGVVEERSRNGEAPSVPIGPSRG